MLVYFKAAVEDHSVYNVTSGWHYARMWSLTVLWSSWNVSGSSIQVSAASTWLCTRYFFHSQQQLLSLFRLGAACAHRKQGERNSV